MLMITLVEKLQIVVICFLILIGGCWVGNLYRLFHCDFKAPYKGEVIHLIGIIPIAAPITVWFSEDK